MLHSPLPFGIQAMIGRDQVGAYRMPSSFWLSHIALLHIADTAHPVLVPRVGFVGMRLGRRLGTCFAPMRDILIDPLVERHHTADHAHREVRARQQTPETKLSGIGMALVAMSPPPPSPATTPCEAMWGRVGGP